MLTEEVKQFEELKERWLKRAKLPTDLTNAKPAFDYSELEQGKIPRFSKDNWNDPAIADLRAILFELDSDEVLRYNDLTIQVMRFGDEWRYLFIEREQEELFILSQYKCRGKVQAFFSAEYGYPIKLDELDSILSKMTKRPSLGRYSGYLEDVKLTIDY